MKKIILALPILFFPYFIFSQALPGPEEFMRRDRHLDDFRQTSANSARVANVVYPKELKQMLLNPELRASVFSALIKTGLEKPVLFEVRYHSYNNHGEVSLCLYFVEYEHIVLSKSSAVTISAVFEKAEGSSELTLNRKPWVVIEELPKNFAFKYEFTPLIYEVTSLLLDPKLDQALEEFKREHPQAQLKLMDVQKKSDSSFEFIFEDKNSKDAKLISFQVEARKPQISAGSNMENVREIVTVETKGLSLREPASLDETLALFEERIQSSAPKTEAFFREAIEKDVAQYGRFAALKFMTLVRQAQRRLTEVSPKLTVEQLEPLLAQTCREFGVPSKLASDIVWHEKGVLLGKTIISNPLDLSVVTQRFVFHFRRALSK